MFKRNKSTPDTDAPQPAQEAVKAILTTALEQDTDVTIVNPANGKKVRVVSKNGNLWIDGEKVG